MLFSQLEEITQGKIHIDQDRDVTHFSTDSRTLSGSQHEIFVAVNGKRDGHNYLKFALEKGVRNFIVERPFRSKACNVLEVPDSVKALQQIGKNHRDKFSIPVIGITGSNGKTTVKEWLSTLLSSKYYVVKSPKSFNSQIGVSLSLMEIREGHEVGVFEAGISKVDEMEQLGQMIQPAVGIFTNLGEAHDGGFESRTQKLSEKLKLFATAEKVICRSDTNEYQSMVGSLGDKLVTWSLEGKADYHIQWKEGEIQMNDETYTTDLEGFTHLENLTHAIVAATQFDLTEDEIQKGIDLIEGVPMRLELKKGVNNSYILDDSYNNDEAGLRVALDYLESHQQNAKRTLILSDILHSGKADKDLYQDVAGLLASKKVDRLIGVGARISEFGHLFKQETQFFGGTDELLSQLPDFHSEMILIKGARNFALERVVQRLEERSHGTVLEVNFEALQFNLNQYRALLKSATRLMVMVKANAYGSGLLEVANFLQHQRVDMLGVAYVDEAIQLRKNGINIPIMIMNPHIESFEQFERYDLQAEIFSLPYLRRLIKDTKEHPKIHLKIDTGMHRLGFDPTDLEDLLSILKENPQVKVEGIFTHFSSSDMEAEDTYTENQAESFEKAYEQITEVLGYQPIRHACNSPAMVRWPQYHYDMVRLGIGLHGFDPTGSLGLRYTSQLKTVISQIQTLKAGETVGYSRSGRIEKESRIAVLPIGYEDGYSRLFGNGKASVFVGGKLCPTVGNICMDMTMVDVTHTEAEEGDSVIVYGDNPTIKELAEWAGTIPYEILTNVSNRVKRVFVSE